MTLRPLVLLVLCSVAGTAWAVSPDPLPELTLTAPATRIDHSCRVVIAPGQVFAAPEGGGGGGVIEIAADGITVEFGDGSILRGAAPDRPLDELTGVGIRIVGHENVTLRNLTLAGFKAAIHATNAKGLTIDSCRVLSGYAQHLKSTTQAEDTSDWLWPHKNDENQWLTSYGAAVYIEDSTSVTLHNIVVRHSQNGIVLDRVNDSRVFDCDCSFLSGWGLAMWRSSRNTIARNALDFCIRGYSHGVYNRGQDSAGLLVFEQCSGNVFAENSATHSGDAFFGFAGREALGETWIDERKTANEPTEPVPSTEAALHKRAGCNDNLLFGNDFSFSAAHGIEMTFSFGNRFVNNRIMGNAICGVWGGYSASTVITGNAFESNGDAGYGDERGGINIEHGRDNRVAGNTFSRNALGVRMWAKPGSALARTPWGVANADSMLADGPLIPSARNSIDRNTFDGERTALMVRNSSATNFSSNTVRRVRQEIDVERGGSVDLQPLPPIDAVPAPADLPGITRPVGARAALDGREHIIMTEWGPWDHRSPLVRMARYEPAASADVHEVLGVDGPLDVERESGECRIVLVQRPSGAPSSIGSDIRVEADELGSGVWPYALRVRAAGLDHRIRGVIVNASWSLTAFAWTHNPLTDLAGWREDAKAEKAITVLVRGLEFPLGYKGPSKIGIAPELDSAGFGATHYGLIARTTLKLGAGRWAVRTLSDDGIRIIVDGTPVIERWNIHGPTPDLAVLTFDEPHAAEIVVEYFQNDGHAALSVAIEPASAAP